MSLARPKLLVASLFVSLLIPAAVAAAPPSTGGSGGAGPEEEACAGRSVGDACSLPNNRMGTCAEATCNRLDYSGGSPPKAIEEACVVCQAGGGQPHDGPPKLGGDGGGESTPDGAGSGGAGSGAASSGASSETKEPPRSESRCTLGDDPPTPAGLALFAGLALWLRRRRHS